MFRMATKLSNPSFLFSNMYPNSGLSIHKPSNEPVLSYKPGSIERENINKALKKMRSECPTVPTFISGKVWGGDDLTLKTQVCPSDNKHVLCKYQEAGEAALHASIDSVMSAKQQWADTPFHQRASIFLKAASLMSTKYRDELNASIMLGQGKTIYQSEIDLAEGIDFLRYNCKYAEEIYAEQPSAATDKWNKLDWRPLEGYVVAIAPFNFWSITLNLCTSPAIMGNVCILKPASSAVLSAWVFYKVLMEAGLPPGVINFVPCRGSKAGKILFDHKDYAGLHFTGSTATFNHIWKYCGDRLDTYASYPRLVGETGGKNYHFVLPGCNTESALESAVNNTLRGAFEYQGQKCSATATCWVPESMWTSFKDKLIAKMKTIKMGQPDDLSNFIISGVIDQASFNNIKGYIDHAKSHESCTILQGGKYDDSTGFTIEPTLVLTTDTNCKLLKEEIFGPVLTCFVYPDAEWVKYCNICANNTDYALTGAIFSNDSDEVAKAMNIMRYASGNSYINVKSTGAVVGSQPFGGGRGSGTNQKAGHKLNLYAWTSPRTICETFTELSDFGYPHMETE